ncbi:hypothetical protein NITUZ_140034 [Candidatus Nitrosotenuis uzonensis]|uniref:Uncharacterized protein n=2 Tax=Candidatus Nitrosotenuis uzonensis TaxID=1407055 RepID=V6AQV0_9ARCH|nr:hypothetical protein NITUZ_140034 [Candidatus Nitrosotenuis uzonensis]
MGSNLSSKEYQDYLLKVKAGLLLTAVLLVFLLPNITDSFAQTNNGRFTFPNGGIVEYAIENGQVSNMEIYHDTKSLRINISAYGDGRLDLSIPRDVLDAKNGYDDSFIVLVNGVQANFDEQTTSIIILEMDVLERII